MRTSREWIERAVADLDVPEAAKADLRVQGAESAASGATTYELTLSPEEAQALDAICREDELSPRQALEHIVRARLLGRPQFGRADRVRLRACLELLRALEQHVGRAARPIWARGQTPAVIGARTQELLDLGAYLRRVGRAIGEAMSGNLDYWRGGAAPAANTDDQPGRDRSGGDAKPEAPRRARS
jgi:hypothetical protein